MKPLVMILLLLCPVLVFAADDEPFAIPVLSGTPPVIDGSAGDKEYPATFTETETGIGISWVADATNLFVCLKSPGKGWVAIGFGAKGMSKASMVLGVVNEKGESLVREELGKTFFRHSPVKNPKLIKGVAALQNGQTVVEFSLPLALSNGKTIKPGEAMPFVLSYNKDDTSLTEKHTKASEALLTVATK